MSYFWTIERRGEEALSEHYYVISAGLRPHQLNWPCLPGDHFGVSAVLIRAAGEESRFHSRKLRNVSARKVEARRDQLFGSTATCSAAERFPHRAETEMSSFPVNVFNSFVILFCIFIWL